MEKRNFDQDALTWDESPVRVALANNVAKAVLDNVELKKDMDVLDFGCGTGLVSFHLCPLVRSVTGADSARGMLEVFQLKVKKQQVGNAKTYFFDPSVGDVVSGKYHVIVSSMVLHHVKDVEALLQQFYDALLPAGKLAIADLDEEGGLFHDNKDGVFHDGFNREMLKELFRKLSFTAVRDITATKVNKPGADGVVRSFSIFLIIGAK